MKFAIAASSLLAAGLFGSLPAAAQKKEPFEALWRIEPQSVSDTALALKPGETITAARLLPVRLIVLQADAVGPGGEVFAAAGTPLIGLLSSTPSACTFSFPHQGAAMRILFGAKQEFTCFLDADNDGKFDRKFRARSATLGVPPAFGRIPAKQTPITAVAYVEKPVGDEDVYPRLLIKYSHRDSITGKGYIGLCMGNAMNKEEPCFSTNSSVSDGFAGVSSTGAGRVIEILGSKIEIVSKQGPLMTVKVLTPFDGKTFSAQEQTSFGWF